MLRNTECVVDPARPNEERVGEPIEKAQRFATGLVFVEKRDQKALGAAADRSREVERRAGSDPPG